MQASVKKSVNKIAPSPSVKKSSNKTSTSPSPSEQINNKKPIPPKKTVSAKLTLHAEYRGDKHFYQTLLFNDSVGLCDSLKKEQKNILQKQIMSNVEKIKLELHELFGSADAVEVSRDNMGRVSVEYPCPYKICQTKEHELKRHFIRALIRFAKPRSIN